MSVWRRMMPSYRRLMRDGAQATAVVVSSPRRRLNGIYRRRVGLEVHFPDGTTTAVERTVNEHRTGYTGTSVGETVTVRYDPTDRARIEVDEAATAHRALTERARVEQSLAGDAGEDVSARPAEPQHGPMDTARLAGSILGAGAALGEPSAEDDGVLDRLDELKAGFRSGELSRDQVADGIRTLRDEQFELELTRFLESPD